MDCKESEIWLGGLESMKGKYIKILAGIDRPGISEVINYLINSDFFKAPASSNNHNNYAGGLVEHSLLVCINAHKLTALYKEINNYESVTICALLHDICKAEFYQESTRNVKKDGVWHAQPYFSIEDKFPLGHGEKSVILLQKLMPLTDPEIMAIRWHMMGFDDSIRSYGGMMALSVALRKYPLITVIHMADLAACYLNEVQL